MLNQDTSWCPECREQRLFARPTVPGWLGLALVICTGGLFLLIWPFAALQHYYTPWRCQRCGTEVPKLLARVARTAIAAQTSVRE